MGAEVGGVAAGAGVEVGVEESGVRSEFVALGACLAAVDEAAADDGAEVSMRWKDKGKDIPVRRPLNQERNGLVVLGHMKMQEERYEKYMDQSFMNAVRERAKKNKEAARDRPSQEQQQKDALNSKMNSEVAKRRLDSRKAIFDTPAAKARAEASTP